MNVWLMAARPKTLTAGVIPVFVGTALAFAHNSEVNLVLAICSLLCALFLQVGTNLINDALDFKKGADTDKRVGPIRVAQAQLLSPSQVMMGGGFSLALAILFGLPLVLKGGLVISCLLVISVMLAYLYTGGPLPLSYCGLGEVFVFLFFGLIATGGAYFIQTLHLSWQALLIGAQIGLLATVLIAINNVRDYYQDKQAKKKTIAVRFGINFGKGVITFCAITPFIINPFQLLPLVTLPLALLIVRKVWQLPPGKEYNQLLGFGALLHLLFGAFLTLGLML